MEKDYNASEELRAFFKELLKKCLAMNTGSGEIKWLQGNYMNKRPFGNTFNTGKKNNNVFTKRVCLDFLELTLRKGNIRTAFDIIKSKYGHFFNDENIDWEILNNCEKVSIEESEKYLDCIAGVSDDNVLFDTSRCENCPVRRIYDVLPEIERECRSRYKAMKAYDSPDEEKRVKEIYDRILKFEASFDGNEVNMDELIKLFQETIRCSEMKDVSDKKLAYVKWYTARLYTLPYLKTYILNSDRKDELKYDEFTVYSLLRSASLICGSMPLPDREEDLKLFCDIEIDKIISYLSVVEQKPFIINRCEDSEDILENCTRIASALKADCQCQLDLYTEMWNLAVRVQLDSSYDVLRIQIEKILKNYDLAREKYYVYLYLNDKCSYKKSRDVLSKKAVKLRSDEMYNDTIYIMCGVFLAIANQNGDFMNMKTNSNPGADIFNLLGFNCYTERSSTVTPDSPASYRRIYGDYKLEGTMWMREYMSVLYNSNMKNSEKED